MTCIIYSFINCTTKYNIFNIVIPTRTHHHNNRQDILQQRQTLHSFVDHNFIHAMILIHIKVASLIAVIPVP